MTNEQELPPLPQGVAHVHSDNEFCWEVPLVPPVWWPVDLFTADQMREYARAALASQVVQEPVAYRFTHNRGNGRTAYTYHDNTPENNWRTAYRDTCLSIEPLYATSVAAGEPQTEGVQAAAPTGDLDRIRDLHQQARKDRAASAVTGVQQGLVTPDPAGVALAHAPVAAVEKEPDYWSRGHFYKGKRHVLRPLADLDKLPIGTQMYAHGVKTVDGGQKNG